MAIIGNIPYFQTNPYDWIPFRSLFYAAGMMWDVVGEILVPWKQSIRAPNNFWFAKWSTTSLSKLWFRLFRHGQILTLVGGLEHGFYFSIQLGMSSAQLTKSIIFQRVFRSTTSQECTSPWFLELSHYGELIDPVVFSFWPLPSGN